MIRSAPVSMGLRTLPFLAAAALLAGCGLLYDYSKYHEADAGQGGATSSTGTSSTGTSSTGTTTSVSTGSGGGWELGHACAMDSDCQSGACSNDNVCCAVPCGACNDCASSMGSVCIHTTANMPGPGCGSPDVCDGMGTCALPVGATCTGSSDCASHHCEAAAAGGGKICCSQTCDVCFGCGASGMCVPLNKFSAAICMTTPGGQDCFGTTNKCQCDGMGACKLEPGGTCTTNDDCLSNNCAGGSCA